MTTSLSCKEYIQGALASGQSREVITQSLIQNGWKTEDIDVGFSEVATPILSVPIPSTASDVQSHSKILIVLGIVTIFVVLGATSGFILFNKKIKVASIGVPNTVASVATTTESVQETSTQQQATSTPVPPIVTPTVKTAPPKMKSEIDVYGTNLYTLKEGKTVKDLGEKTIETIFNDRKVTVLERTTVTYTRSGDKIRVAVEKKSVDLGTYSYGTTVMLNAKQNYTRSIASLKSKIEQGCPNTDTPDCKLMLGWLGMIEKCKNVTTDKEMNICMNSYDDTGTDYNQDVGFSGGGILWGLLGF